MDEGNVCISICEASKTDNIYMKTYELSDYIGLVYVFFTSLMPNVQGETPNRQQRRLTVAWVLAKKLHLNKLQRLQLVANSTGKEAKGRNIRRNCTKWVKSWILQRQAQGALTFSVSFLQSG